MESFQTPIKQGLYDPKFEHDACGIGFMANLKGDGTHHLIQRGLEMLYRLEHRGAQGSDPNTGDGAGIMTGLPHSFFKKACSNFDLNEQGSYGVGMVFLPQDRELRKKCEEIFQEVIVEEDAEILGWRTVPVNDSIIGKKARKSQPYIRQIFIGRKKETSPDDFERKLYLIRKRTEHKLSEYVLKNNGFYVVSLSSRTIVYKGMLTPKQLDQYYLDLQDPSFQSSFILVHSRYSTNTFPNWERAHPNRMLVHNGEINTLNGNIHWMKAREKGLQSIVFGEKLTEMVPIISPNGSDSAAFDNCLEFLIHSGRPLPHAAMMMVPEPWEKNVAMEDSLRAFYEYHSHLMEPWDGPAAFAFTDGLQIGAMQDRNGLRPARYYVTMDDMIIFASEAGVIDIEPEQIIEKGRLSPGKMLLIDLQEGRIIPDEEIKGNIAQQHPYRKWLQTNSIPLRKINTSEEPTQVNTLSITQYQKIFGYTMEDLKNVIGAMAATGKEPINSMGNDMPLAVLSNHAQLLYNYFRQLFAQVTNPPIDAIRERYVTSTATSIGPEGNLLHPTGENCQRILLETPLLTNQELASLRDDRLHPFKVITQHVVFPASNEIGALKKSLDQLFESIDREIEAGASLIILSDQILTEQIIPIPMLLATSALHQHLVRKGTRSKVSLLIETGEARDVHQLAMLIGYGADAINPCLAIASIKELVENNEFNEELPFLQAQQNYLHAATDGIVKILSKMGISTIQSYRGAQIFEAIGIDDEVIDLYFTGTSSRLEGITLDVIAEESKIRHQSALMGEKLGAGSDFKYRKDGETHAFRPDTIHLLKNACRKNDYSLYKEYAEKANQDQLIFIRDLITYKERKPIPLEEVEPVETIVRRFRTGAMSYGSLSKEAHETLAIAMNRLGGKSNSGEGGEHPGRGISDENGDSRRSKIKQVASGRFGVTSHYLVSADEIQIKMAQGAKPGEGGQLPGDKVDPWIAEVRGSTPGVGLISPPPHHDIYSIEDLAQLIHDLKNANPKAKISVKLVSKAGVGTIAAGVAKGKADSILISGSDGGTGAAPRSSIKHAGMPWELGLAEAHQTLLLNGLRKRVTLEVDGKLMTGRDLIIATLLGAEEYGFATSALVALGCVLVRQCHLNTCPVGIATQDPKLRKKFLGAPEHVENFMRFIAEDVREIMAQLGFRSINEMVGRTDLLTSSTISEHHWKAKYLNLNALLYQPPHTTHESCYKQEEQNHELQHSLDFQQLLPLYQQKLKSGEKMSLQLPIYNTNRSVGTLLGSEVTRNHGREGLTEDSIQLNFFGTAGQSFGAFVPKGLTLTLEGDANDYVGKGLSGGKIIVYPSEQSLFVPEENTVIGNIAFYGATSGEAYIRGLAGERFCIRNSGIKAVVEGIGDHGCEYMTGGVVVVLGSVGKNFAAGMTGGCAYVFSEELDGISRQSNLETVEIEPLEAEDIHLLKELISNHSHYTGSTKAAYLLKHWNSSVLKFRKFISKEYKKSLQLHH